MEGLLRRLGGGDFESVGLRGRLLGGGDLEREDEYRPAFFVRTGDLDLDRELDESESEAESESESLLSSLLLRQYWTVSTREHIPRFRFALSL